MPISFTIDDVAHIVRTEAIGPVTFDDIQRHLSDESRAGGIPYREVIDGTRATAAFDGADARRIVQRVRDLATKGAFGPTAVIVSNDVTYGMVRMIEMLVEDVVDVRPFSVTQRAEAEAWVQETPIRGRPP